MNEKDYFLNCNDKDFIYWIIIFAFWENLQKEWDKLRDLDIINPDKANEEYEIYFNELFRLGIPVYTIKIGQALFRARHIKSNDTNKLAVNIHDITDAYCKIILSEDEILQTEELNKEGGLYFTLQHLFMLKAKGMENFTEEQQKRMNELIEENSIKKVYGFPEKDSRVPPIAFRKPGRLNVEKDAYLYLAFDKDTAIHEMRPSIGQKYSIAEFRTNKELKFADLTGKQFEPVKGNLSLSFIANKISEPNADNKDEFYHITQFMAHLLQKQGYDGIMYKSSLKKEENNILLFDESSVDFISSEIIIINNVSVDYSYILPFVSNEENNSNISNQEITAAPEGTAVEHQI